MPQQLHLPSRSVVFAIPGLHMGPWEGGLSFWAWTDTYPHPPSRGPRPSPGPPHVQSVNLQSTYRLGQVRSSLSPFWGPGPPLPSPYPGGRASCREYPAHHQISSLDRTKATSSWRQLTWVGMLLIPQLCKNCPPKSRLSHRCLSSKISSTSPGKSGPLGSWENAAFFFFLSVVLFLPTPLTLPTYSIWFLDLICFFVLFCFCLGYPLWLHSSSASDLVITVSDGSSTSQALQLFLNSLSPHIYLLPSPQRPQQAGLLYTPFPPPTLKICYLWEWSASQLLGTSLGCCGPMPVPLSQANPLFLLGLSYKAHLPAWRLGGPAPWHPKVLLPSRSRSCQLLPALSQSLAILPLSWGRRVWYLYQETEADMTLSKPGPVNRLLPY